MNSNSSCSITSETQSMSVRRIKDPNTGEFLTPSEAIKRKLLDPYNGMFIDPTTSERFPISDAISKGLVIAETLHDSNNNNKPSLQSTSITNESNVISTSLIRETKSYHLLSVYDPVKNDEITIKEAINLGILDRQKGLYINTVSKESLSISEAINKGFIRARVLSPQPPDAHLPFQVLVSTNRFEENRTYTICGAIDPRNGKKISISQAINDGIIDVKNGTYFNLITGEIYSINKAIEFNLVLTEKDFPVGDDDNKSTSIKTINNNTTHTPNLNNTNTNSNANANNREVKTLNIEFVKDPRTDRNITVSEAMQNGLLDRQSLNYLNPFTNERLSLDKAYQKGYIIGQYVDSSYFNETSTATSSRQHHYHQQQYKFNQKEDNKSYFIISVYDPISLRSLTLDQAIQSGIFDYNRGVYIHPISKEVLSLSDAIRKNFVDAQEYETNNNESKRINESRCWPVGDFGKDKKITSIRTKLKKDGTNSLQIDIEHIKPTSDTTYEPIDHMNGVRINEDQSPKRVQSYHQQQINTITSSTSSLHKYQCQVLDINSTEQQHHQQQQQPSLSNTHEDMKKHVVQITPQTITSSNSSSSGGVSPFKEKNLVIHQINKEYETSLNLSPIEKLTDDEDEKRFIRVKTSQMDLPKTESKVQDNKCIVLDKIEKDAPQTQIQIKEVAENKRSEEKPSIADNNNNNKKVGTLFFKNEMYINQMNQPVKIDYELAPKNVDEINEILLKIENQNINLVNHKLAASSSDLKGELKQANKPNVIESERDENKTKREDEKKLVINNKSEQKPTIRPLPVIFKNSRPTNTDSVEDRSQTLRRKDFLNEIRIEKQSRQIPIVERDKEDKDQPKKKKDKDEDEDEEEESFNEWTEVLTLKNNDNNNKFKITWVYDPLKDERVNLNEALKRNLVDLNTNKYKNMKSIETVGIKEAIEDGLVGVQQDNSTLSLKLNGIAYIVYWVWDCLNNKRLTPKKAIEKGLLDLNRLLYRNNSNGKTLSLDEAIRLKLIRTSDNLSNQNQQVDELPIEINNIPFKILWVQDSRSKEKLKPKDALMHDLLDLTNNVYSKFDTDEYLPIAKAIEQGYIGVDDYSNKISNSQDEEDKDRHNNKIDLNKPEQILMPNDEKVTIKTKTAVYVITGLVDPVTQKEMKVSEGVEQGVLNIEHGTYNDLKNNVVYDVGEAINEGIVFATISDLLQDETASNEFIREEVKKFIVKSVIDPRTNLRIGGLQAIGNGILNLAKGMYTNMSTNQNIPIPEAIQRKLIDVTLQEETSTEEFDVEVITETLLDRTIINYRILGVIDPSTKQLISPFEACHRQIIDSETNAYIDPNQIEPIPIKEAVRRGLIKAQVTEKFEKKNVGLTLQNAIKLGSSHSHSDATKL